MTIFNPWKSELIRDLRLAEANVLGLRARCDCLEDQVSRQRLAMTTRPPEAVATVLITSVEAAVFRGSVRVTFNGETRTNTYPGWYHLVPVTEEA